jgi:hypothetical protein
MRFVLHANGIELLECNSRASSSWELASPRSCWMGFVRCNIQGQDVTGRKTEEMFLGNRIGIRMSIERC